MQSRLSVNIITFCVLVALGYIIWPKQVPPSPHIPRPVWEIRSIDTMKYSRDLAREKGNDPLFQELIDAQVSQIASTGATHVGVATPYDVEFIPVLTRWVEAARRYSLKVWFRGNLSGWEGWFDYPLMSKAAHTSGVVAFIESNPTLFENGDYFSSCPECENGHLGDPRHEWPVADYRQFLINEHRAVNAAFRQVGKNVGTNLHSMNYDVATLVMDEATTRELGGVVAIDHYVKDPLQLASDVETIAKKSGGRVFLGEFGAPIPDIHGQMTADEQAEWVNTALEDLESSKSLIGVNYWVGVGGSTAIWNDDSSAKPAVEILTKYYRKIK